MNRTLQSIQDEAHETALSKGWHEEPLRDAKTGRKYPDRILAKHALIHSEITEAVDSFDEGELELHYPKGKPEGFVVEIADTIIRIADTAGALEVKLVVPALALTAWQERALQLRPAIEIAAAQLDSSHLVYMWIGRARRHLDRATEAVRVGDWQLYGTSLTHTVLHLASVCAGLGLDLEESLHAKMAFNRTRPYRHGGKLA